jgi:prepilin-type processing-associated H-X9-DG protein
MRFSSFRNGRCRVAAFTLVELLVVIGIIALLISILLPALAKARENANQVKCSAQQKQILQGMMLHANDHRGYMPLAGLLHPTPSPKNVADEKRQKYEFLGTNDTNFTVSATAAGVGKYLGADLDFRDINTMQKSLLTGIVRKIFVCPSDKQGGRFGMTVNSGGSYWASYCFNEGPLGWSDAPGGIYHDPNVTGHVRLRGNTARFPHPSQLLLVGDAAPRNKLRDIHTENGSAWMLFNDAAADATLGDWWRATQGLPGKPVGIDLALLDEVRHKGRIVVGFADGHVENLKLSFDLDKVYCTVDFPKN